MILKKGVCLFFDFFQLQSLSARSLSLSIYLSLVFYFLVCSPDIVSESVGSYLSPVLSL